MPGMHIGEDFIIDSLALQEGHDTMALTLKMLMNNDSSPKKITSYSEGISKKLKPRTTNLGEIVALYNNALYKALAERTAVDRLLSAVIPDTVKALAVTFAVEV